MRRQATSRATYIIIKIDGMEGDYDTGYDFCGDLCLSWQIS